MGIGLERSCALAVLLLSADVLAQPVAPPPPAPKPAPPMMPWLAYLPDPEADAAVHADLMLGQALGPAFTGLVVGVVPAGTPAAESCGRMVAEVAVSRERYEALGRGDGGRERLLRLRFRPPCVGCGTEVAVTVCGVRADGSRVPSEFAPAAESPQCERPGGTVATPSGPLRVLNLRPGHVVVSRDPVAGVAAVASVVRVGTVRGPGVAVVLSDGRRASFASTERVWDAARKSFVPGRALGTGSRLLDDRLVEVAVASVTADAEPRLRPSIAVDGPGTLYLDGFLVAAANGPARKPGVAPAPETGVEPVAAVPWPQSYDCLAGVDLRAAATVEGARAYRLVLHPHGRIRPGERVPVDCAAWKTAAIVESPAIEALLALPAGTRLGFELEAGCDALVDVGVCAGPAGGPAAPVGLARMAVAGPTCLATGTLVDTPDGPRPIETLATGAAVSSWDAATGRSAVARVLRLRPIPDRPTLDVTLDDGTHIVATPEHPFYRVGDAAFVPAARLGRGDRLRRRDGTEVAVAAVRPAGPATVWDLTLTAPNAYFAAGVLVHNY